MRLLSVGSRTGSRLGVLAEDGAVIDVTALGESLGKAPGAAASLSGLIAAGPRGRTSLTELLAAEPSTGDRPWRIPYRQARLDVPLVPPAVLCSGENYADHLAEKPKTSNREPEFFLKAPTTVAADGVRIPIDRRMVTKLDSEVELAVVIGRTCRDVAAAQALEHVFGYTVALDLSARDRQLVRHECGGWMYDLVRGKNFDGALPFGPVVVTADAIPDPQALRIRGYVDGECRQDSSTAQMIWSVAELVSYFSRFFTLVPGAVLATGTPGGTAWGFDPELGGAHAKPGVAAPYVRDGQRLSGEIDGIGSISVTVHDA